MKDCLHKIFVIPRQAQWKLQNLAISLVHVLAWRHKFWPIQFIWMMSQTFWCLFLKTYPVFLNFKFLRHTVKQYSILPPAIPLTSSVVYKVSQTLLMFCCYRNRSTTREDNFHLIFKIFQTLWWTRPWMTLLWHWMLNWTNHSTEDSVHNYSFCPSCESSSHTPNVLTECKSRILNHFNLSQICWFEP